MRTTTWPGLGSLPVKLTLGLAIAAALSAALPARAGELHGCAGSRAAARTATPARPAPAAASSHRSYLTAVRMGWA
jgi:gamma-glutamyl:cysteine ligase YbdK (ATP-grasp superfamily)